VDESSYLRIRTEIKTLRGSRGDVRETKCRNGVGWPLNSRLTIEVPEYLHGHS
jgi:hypothetical protein